MQPTTPDTARLLVLAAFAVAGVLLVLSLVTSNERGAAMAALSGAPTLAAQAPAPPSDVTPTPEVAPTPDQPSDATVVVDRGVPTPSADAAPAQPPADTRPCAKAQLLVTVPRDLQVRSRPGGGRVIGSLPARSKYLGSAMRAWVRQVSPNGQWGLVDVPWVWPQRSGWIRLRGLERTRSSVTVRTSLRRRELRVLRGCRVVLRVPTAIGASASPSPRGRFFVTDTVPVPASQPYFGSYAFGMSTIQPNLPPGWRGGDQMAIHGTNTPATIGSASSAGCLRVSEPALSRLRALLRPGTPVIIEA